MIIRGYATPPGAKTVDIEEMKKIRRELSERNRLGGNQIIIDDKTLLKVIHAQLENADAAIAAQHWEGADKLIRQALAELGDRYVCPGTIDETDMKLIAADLREREGKFDNAVRVRRKMLAARLEMLRGKTK